MVALRDPFQTIHKKPKRNKDGTTTYLDYISWSQAADRLDEAAPDWTFQVLQMGDDWVLGRLTIGNRTFDNFGYAENADASWKSEVLKDAASDALKRCAALAGVARYLYDKDAPTTSAGASERQQPPASRERPGTPPSASASPRHTWHEGEVHAEGHRPLQINRKTGKSLSCPTKVDGAWCTFEAPLPPKPHPLPADDEPPPIGDDELASLATLPF